MFLYKMYLFKNKKKKILKVLIKYLSGSFSVESTVDVFDIVNILNT